MRGGAQASDRRRTANDGFSYRNSACANAASIAEFPVGAHTRWFHCFFKSFAMGNVADVFWDVAADFCGINAAKLLTVVRIRLTAAAIRAESVGFERCADPSNIGKF